MRHKPDPELMRSVRAERLRQKLTVRALGKRIGVSFSTLARLERGSGRPSVDNEERLRLWLKTGESLPPTLNAKGTIAWAQLVERRSDLMEERMDEIEVLVARLEAKLGISKENLEK